MTETALAITPAGLTGRGKPAFSGFDMVYLGSETCPRLIPSPAEVRLAMRLGARRVVVVTPIVTDRQLDALDRLAGKLVSALGQAEFSVNDTGALHFLSRKYGPAVSFSLGRVISADFLKMGPLFLRRLCAGYGVKIIETDDPVSARECLRSGLFPLAFHQPLRLLSVTRVCPHGPGCGRRCGELPKPLKHAAFGGGELLLRQCGYYAAAGGRPPAAARLVLSPFGARPGAKARGAAA